MEKGVIYRVIDGSVFCSMPEGAFEYNDEVISTSLDALEKYVLPNFKGDKEDYAFLPLSDEQFISMIGREYVRVEDGQLVLGPLVTPVETDTEKIARLEVELAAEKESHLNTMDAVVQLYEQVLAIEERMTV